MTAFGRQLPVTKGSYRPIKTLGFGRFRPKAALREGQLMTERGQIYVATQTKERYMRFHKVWTQS